MIECPFCRSRVDAKVDGETTEHSSPDDPQRMKVCVGKCPSCGNVLVGRQEELEHPDWGLVCGDAERLWPQPKRSISRQVPEIV